MENGYNTFALGKWHLCNDSLCSAAGPYDEWPLGRGFDKFYGFHHACNSQFYPNLVCGNEFVDQPRMPEEGYHLSEDITDRGHHVYRGPEVDQPRKAVVFCYLAYGAQHFPHQVPKKYVERYKGTFDDGWEAYREKVF